MSRQQSDFEKLDDYQLVALCKKLATEQEEERKKLIGLSRQEFYAQDRAPFWNVHNRLVAAAKEAHRRGLEF